MGANDIAAVIHTSVLTDAAAGVHDQQSVCTPPRQFVGRRCVDHLALSIRTTSTVDARERPSRAPKRSGSATDPGATPGWIRRISSGASRGWLPIRSRSPPSLTAVRAGGKAFSFSSEARLPIPLFGGHSATDVIERRRTRSRWPLARRELLTIDPLVLSAANEFMNGRGCAPSLAGQPNVPMCSVTGTTGGTVNAKTGYARVCCRRAPRELAEQTCGIGR